MIWVHAFEAVALGYLALVIGSYTLTSLAALAPLVRLRLRADRFHTAEALAAASAPPISLLVPMYNEEAVCVESVKALLGVAYPTREVLVVNDGSTDGTVARLVDAFDLVETPRLPVGGLTTAPVRRVFHSRTRPDLWLIDKANGGKADALNAGLAYCRTPLFCMLDGDSLLAPDALLRAAQPFLEDAATVAVGGTIGVANGAIVRAGLVTDVRMPRSWLARFQTLEYLRAFAAARSGWASFNGLLIVSGAFGLFRRAPVVAIGGLDDASVGEDMELVMRLHRYHLKTGTPYRIAYAPDAISWTEVPESTRVLGRQRDRWHRGLAQVLWRHRRMLFRRTYGRIGWVAMPAFVLVELLGPVAEFVGLVALLVLGSLGAIDWPVAGLMYLLALVLGMAQSLAAVALEQLAFRRYTRTSDLLLLLALAVLENVGYRQLTVWWRLRGLVGFLRDDKSWGEMTRTGFNVSPAPHG